MLPWIHLGPSGKGSLQGAVNSQGCHLWGARADKDNLRQLRQNSIDVLTSESHVDHPQEEYGANAGGGHLGRGDGDICGVLPPSANFSGLYGEWVPIEVPHDDKARRTFYVH